MTNDVLYVPSMNAHFSRHRSAKIRNSSVVSVLNFRRRLNYHPPFV